MEKSFNRGKVDFSVEMSKGTRLKIFVRLASTKVNLKLKEWRDATSGKFSLDKKDRYLMYKAIFISDNRDRFPVLDSVKIELDR